MECPNCQSDFLLKMERLITENSALNVKIVVVKKINNSQYKQILLRD